MRGPPISIWPARAGLSGETIEVIRARRRPEFGRDDERIVYDLVTELLASKK
jgi:hypothetical protein